MAAPSKPELEESFKARVNVLFRELELSIRFNRPSILLAIYSSEFVRADAEAALTAKLRELKQTIVPYRVTGEENADIPLYFSQYADKTRAVFFVSGLQRGGGADERNTYRALNIRREYFVDYRIRAVFWLTEKEAIALPNYAPDFWAFRHRAIEFVEPPAPERIVPAAKELAWAGLLDRAPFEDIDAKIALREALLSDLPDSDETMVARADLLQTLALLYGLKRSYEKAIQLFQQVLTIAKRLENTRLQSQCYIGLGVVYDALKRNEEAISSYQRASELDPKTSARYHILQGVMLASNGRTDDAIAAYQRAIELDQKWAMPHNGLGNVYAGLGRHDEAFAAYQRAIELDPKWAIPHSNLGNVYAGLGRHDEALAAYKQAIELDPKWARPHDRLGDTYNALGRHDDAIAAYQRAAELDPKWATPHNNLGSVYETLGRRNDAIAAYKRAIELNSTWVFPYNQLGHIYRTSGRIEEALVTYQRAIELDPKSISAYNGLGHVYRDLGRYDEAIIQYQRGIDNDPKQTTLYMSLGVAYNAIGEIEKALAAYNKVIEFDPDHAATRGLLAGLYRKLGREAEYIEQVRIARELMVKEIEYNRACFEALCGNRDEALALLKVALEKKQESPEWAWRDPDFDFIRDDPHFKDLVGRHEDGQPTSEV